MFGIFIFFVAYTFKRSLRNSTIIKGDKLVAPEPYGEVPIVPSPSTSSSSFGKDTWKNSKLMTTGWFTRSLLLGSQRALVITYKQLADGQRVLHHQ